MPRRRSKRGLAPWLLIAAGFAAGAGRLTAAEDAPVALPPFLVEEPLKGPPWRYAEAMGYEILSRCEESTTRKVVEAHDRLNQLLAEILPPALQVSWTVPRALILYDEELQPKGSQEVIARMLRSTTETPPVELELPGRGGLRTTLPARRVSFLPNLRLWDRDGMVVFMIVRSDGFEPNTLALTHDYVSFLVRSRVPTLPLWFMSGFLDLYRVIEFERTQLRAPPLTWISEAFTDLLKNDPKKAPPVMPLAEFFRGAIPAEMAETVPRLKHWQAQAALLVRWGLDSRERGRRDGFVKLVEQAATRGMSEALFEECLGMNFATAQAQLVAYLPEAVRRRAAFRPERLVKLSRFPLIPASDAQLARIKGDLERLEVNYVKAISPDLQARYLEQARRTLRRGYEWASTDPQLVAVLGLCEIDAGNDKDARDYLERAAELGPIRPRANYELARLRLAEARAAPDAPEGRISSVGLAAVLKPLFAARELQPALPEVYELIAEAWGASLTAPTRRHLAVLDEGVRLFPRRLLLVLRTAELYRHYGFTEEAKAVVDQALPSTVDEAARTQLRALRARLVEQE